MRAAQDDGAAGGLGKVLRERLRPYTQVLRLSDIASMAPPVDADLEPGRWLQSDHPDVQAMAARHSGGTRSAVGLMRSGSTRPFCARCPA